jgi:hypothetical protein
MYKKLRPQIYNRKKKKRKEACLKEKKLRKALNLCKFKRFHIGKNH